MPPEISSNQLLSGLTDEENNTLFQQMKTSTFQQGDVIIHAGEEGNELYFIASGEVEVFYAMHDGINECHFEHLSAGDSFGERALLKNKMRTASVRATATTVTYSINTQLLMDQISGLANFSQKIYKNLANKFSQLLGENNAAIISSLEKELEATQVRAAMGSFIVSLVIGLCLFVFVSDTLERLGHTMALGSFITKGMLIITAGAFYLLAKSYPFPKSTFGFTLVDWKKSLFEGVIFSAVLALVLTGIKYFVISYFPAYSSLPLFNPHKVSFSSYQEAFYIIAIGLAYILVSGPLQEFIIRGGLQGSLRVFLQGKYKDIWAILAANMVFALMHLYLSVGLALGAFFIGIFWGWLFSRHQSLLGTVVSHILIGSFLFFGLGIRDFFFR